jgi:ATP-dependent Clp protease ATP-binding subunit ClpB
LPEGRTPRAKRDVMDAVRAHFRPEFLNRLDDMIVFDRLTRDDMDGIVTIQLARLEKRLASARSCWSWTRARGNGWPTRAMIRSSARGR